MDPGDERGPVLEVIVSRTNFISSHTSKKVRVVGLSTALANARDLADWLGIKEVCLLLLGRFCALGMLHFKLQRGLFFAFGSVLYMGMLHFQH